MRTGAPRHDLPRHHPPNQSCHRGFQRWQRSGRFAVLLQRLAEDLRDRGKIDLSEAFGDATFAGAKKGGAAVGLLDAVMVFLSPSSWPALHRVSRTSSPPPSTRFLADLPTRLIGDRGYDRDALDERLMTHYGIEMVAAHRRGRRSTQDGRALRRARRRWKIERLFAWLHNSRRLVTR